MTKTFSVSLATQAGGVNLETRDELVDNAQYVRRAVTHSHMAYDRPSLEAARSFSVFFIHFYVHMHMCVCVKISLT